MNEYTAIMDGQEVLRIYKSPKHHSWTIERRNGGGKERGGKTLLATKLMCISLASNWRFKTVVFKKANAVNL